MSAEEDFAALAGDYLDDLARRHPDVATELGDHRFDDRLPDLSAPPLAAERRALDEFAARLAAIETTALTASCAWTRRCSARHRAPGLRARRPARAHLEPAARQPRAAIYALLARDSRRCPTGSHAAGRLAETPRPRRRAAASARCRRCTWRPRSPSSAARSAGHRGDRRGAATGGAARPGRRGPPGRARGLAGHRDWLSAELARARQPAASPTRGSAGSSSPASCR